MTNNKTEGVEEASKDNNWYIRQGIDFAKEIKTTSESYKNGAAFGYACGLQEGQKPPSPPAGVEQRAKDEKLEQLANLLKEKGLRRYLNINGFGYSQIERDIVDLLSPSIAGSESQGQGAVELRNAYAKWCKETKRNGSVLVGGSIYEFFDWLEKH